MRFEPESLHDANAGLAVARELMERIKKEFDWISYGDLWTLAGVAAIQVRISNWCHIYLILKILNHRKWQVQKFDGGPGESMDMLRMPLRTGVSLMLLRELITCGMCVGFCITSFV